jgi:hypothetical protein
MERSAALWVFILTESVVVLWPAIRHTETWSGQQIIFAILGPCFWFVGLRQKRPILTLLLVPLTWFCVLGHLLVDGLTPFDLTLMVICVLIYVVTTADHVGLPSRDRVANALWTPTRSPAHPTHHIAFIALLAGLFCSCIVPVAYPELLIAENSAWSHYRVRIQTLVVLLFGLQSMFIIDQINRRLASYQRRNGLLWLALTITGLGGGFFMDGF